MLNPPGALVPVFDERLTADSSPWLNIPIPGGGKSLRIVSRCRSTNSGALDNLRLRFNGDQGNNYNYAFYSWRITNALASAGNQNATQMLLMLCQGDVGPDDFLGTAEITIPDYSADVGWKSVHGQGHVWDSTDGNYQRAVFGVGSWKSEAPITTLDFFPHPSGRVWIAGTRLSIWIEV